MLYYPVGVIAMDGDPWELEGNFRRMEEHAREAVRRRAKIVVAPEGVLDGYVQSTAVDVTPEQMRAVAQTVPDGPYLQRAGQLCRELGIYLVFGFLERRGEELFNTCALFDPRGEIIAHYSKVHPCGESFITPGRELRTFDTPLGRVGFLICSDRHVVDNFSTLGAQGVGILFLPMNGSGGPSNTAIMRQRARDNRCFLVIANSTSSVIIDPSGEPILEKYEAECVGIGHLHAYSIPKGEERDHFMQRRPDLYAPLTGTIEPEMHFDRQGNVEPYEQKSRDESQARLRERTKECQERASGTSLAE